MGRRDKGLNKYKEQNLNHGYIKEHHIFKKQSGLMEGSDINENPMGEKKEGLGNLTLRVRMIYYHVRQREKKY